MEVAGLAMMTFPKGCTMKFNFTFLLDKNEIYPCFLWKLLWILPQNLYEIEL
jgi:hypothetical protein